jgi:hypothetical protein
MNARTSKITWNESNESADVTVEKPTQKCKVQSAAETVLRALKMTSNVPKNMPSHLYKIEQQLLQNFEIKNDFLVSMVL